MQKILGGHANVDDNVLDTPAGSYRAAAVRIFDPATNAWSIFWIDSRYPPSSITNPVVGGIENGHGVFFSDDEWDGRQIQTRFLWHVDAPDACRWEQAFSPDGGATWETNWYMDFERAASPSTERLLERISKHEPLPGSLNDFDFLVGRWHVRHRCLIRNTWEEFDGECSMQQLLGGQANFDENNWASPGDANQAIAIRVFDPAHDTWSIFWLDRRWPSTFGPPVIGGFDGDHGIFFGDDELDGQPIRVRFDWFIDGADSCRWEQAFSTDGGIAWETNWQMQFTRSLS
jgi:hypothetical protein